jgi:hypothetical protein
MTNRITTGLLLAIAVGLWLNIFTQPEPVQAQAEEARYQIAMNAEHPRRIYRVDTRSGDIVVCLTFAHYEQEDILHRIFVECPD